MEVILQDGAAVIQGPSIQQLIHDAALSTDSESQGHILFLSKTEVDALSASKRTALFKLSFDHLYSLGIAQDGSTQFLMVIWNAGYLFRKSLKLPSHPFFPLVSSTSELQRHILPTLSNLKQPLDLRTYGPNVLDHLAFALLHFGDFELSSQAAILLCEKAPLSEKGWLRLGDVAFKDGMFKRAMLAYGHLLHISGIANKLSEYAVDRITMCAEHTEWAQIFTDDEFEQVPPLLMQYFLESWSPSVREMFSSIYPGPNLPSLQLDRFTELSVYIPPSQFKKLPGFFRWLVPFQIAVSSAPNGEEDIALLSSKHLGIKHIISLTDYPAMEEAWFWGKSIKHTIIPIQDFHPPSIEQVECIMEILMNPSNLPVLIHCSAGIGRTGTIAACYLVAFGFQLPNPDLECPSMEANDAISALRGMRPGSVETHQQEALVAKWASVIWKRRSVLRPVVEEPPPCSLEIVGEVPPDADLLVLIGLQGAGKTWFSRALRSRNFNGWKRVSQDESGSRALCEKDIGRDPHGKRVILDRCNPTSKDRAYWRQLAHWASKPVLVWFDYPEELCTSRAQRRIDHPTLTPGSQVRTAISSTAAQLERPPTNPETEGFIGIAIIRSFKACEELVSLFSPPINLFKFPRTAHLLDLGAATEDDLYHSHDQSFRPSAARPFTVDSDSTLIITEKVDGANLGISLNEKGQIVIQNRAHWVNSKTHFQFKKLDLWIDEHHEGLHRILAVDETFPQRFVLFGEWLVCTHSINYSRLPDQFLAFDMYDRTTDTFASREILEGRLRDNGIDIVPIMEIRRSTPETQIQIPTDDELRAMVQRPSRFYDGRVEGIYLKLEKGGRVIDRGKVVRGDFIAGNEHWTKGNLTLNGIVKARYESLT